MIMKGVKTCLAGQRTLGNDIRYTTSHDKGSDEAKQYKYAMDKFNQAKPAKENKDANGKGTGHPWGAPRNVVVATMAELACARFSADAKLLERAKTVFGEMTQPTPTGLAKMLTETPKHKDGLQIWKGMLTFGRAREARNGDWLITIPHAKVRFTKPIAEQVGLLGVTFEFVVGLVMFPWMDKVLEGPAPRGNMERQLERLLKGMTIDDDDEDNDL